MDKKINLEPGTEILISCQYYLNRNKVNLKSTSNLRKMNIGFRSLTKATVDVNYLLKRLSETFVSLIVQIQSEDVEWSYCRLCDRRGKVLGFHALSGYRGQVNAAKRSTVPYAYCFRLLSAATSQPLKFKLYGVPLNIMSDIEPRSMSDIQDFFSSELVLSDSDNDHISFVFVRGDNNTLNRTSTIDLAILLGWEKTQKNDSKSKIKKTSRKKKTE